MTRKDFELIAKAIRDQRDQPVPDPLDALAYRLASALFNTNPRFDRERFLKACGGAP